MIILVALMVGFAAFGAGFVVGVSYGVKREAERWTEGIVWLERRRRRGELGFD